MIEGHAELNTATETLQFFRKCYTDEGGDVITREAKLKWLRDHDIKPDIYLKLV